MLKSFGIIPYSISLVRNIMLDVPGMDNWDKSFNKHEIVEEYPEENGTIKSIEYLFIKFPLTSILFLEIISTMALGSFHLNKTQKS